MIDVKVKFFFDRKAVIDAVGKARARVLARAGAFIRRTGRTLVRPRKKVSQPGEPPSTHTSNETVSLRNIQFYYDPQSKSVVVGPVRISTVSKGFKSEGTVPQTLESGGNVSITEKLTRHGWRPVGIRPVGGGQPVRTRTVNYQARPFMAPALKQNLPKLPELWKDAVVRSN